MLHSVLAVGLAKDPWDLLESGLQKSLCVSACVSVSVCNLTVPRLPPKPCCPSPHYNCRDMLSTANLSLPQRVASLEPAAPPYTECREMGLSLPGKSVNC